MDAINRILSTYVLNALWQIPVIAATAWLCLRFAKRLPARHHHIVWVAALLLGVVLPLVSLPRPSVSTRPETAAPLHLAKNGARDLLLPKNSPGIVFRGVQFRRQDVALRPSLQWTLALVYLAFLAYRLLRLAWALRRTGHLVANLTDAILPNALKEVVDRLVRQYRLSDVPIKSSREATSPFIAGTRRPMLVLPESLLRETSEADLSGIFAHEFAHLRRRDFLLNLAYEIVSIPVAFHPITALIKQRIEDSRELACDEIAADQTGSRSEYASSLLRIAQSISGKSFPKQASHALGLFETDNLEERIMSLLARKNRIGETVGRILLGLVATVFAAVCLGISGFALQVNAATSDAYLGTWRADYQGQNFILIQLNEEKGQVAGTVQMRNTQIDLEGSGEVYHVSGNLSDPMNLTDIRFEGNALLFQFLEEGDTDAVHWRMELNSPEKASLYWVELPNGLNFKPIALAKDSIESESKANNIVTRSTNNPGDHNSAYVLGDLKIEGDVHAPSEVRNRILTAWKDREYDSSQELIDSVVKDGIRGDFQDRGYFKAVVQDPVSRALGSTGAKQQVLVVVSVVEGPQFRLGTLTLQSSTPSRALAIPVATLRAQFHMQDGSLFNVSEIRASLKRIAELYGTRGYADAKIEPDTRIDDSSQRIDLIIHITEGPLKH